MIETLPRRDEPFVRHQTALLLVDMQRIWLEPGLDPGHADWGPDHYFYRQTRETVIPNQQPAAFVGCFVTSVIQQLLPHRRIDPPG